MLEIEGRQGSNLTAKTGLFYLACLFLLCNAIFCGVALALSIAESNSLSGYSLDNNILFNPMGLLSLLSVVLQILMILQYSENGIFLVTLLG